MLNVNTDIYAVYTLNLYADVCTVYMLNVYAMHMLARQSVCILNFHYFCYHYLIVHAIYELLFCLLSCSLYVHLVAFTINLPIHSSADSSDCPPGLLYCSNNIVSVCCIMNLLLHVPNSPFTVSRFLF